MFRSFTRFVTRNITKAWNVIKGWAGVGAQHAEKAAELVARYADYLVTALWMIAAGVVRRNQKAAYEAELTAMDTYPGTVVVLA